MRRGLWMFALASLATAGDEDTDVAVATRVAAALPAGEMTVAEFLRKLAPARTDEDRGIGFGARRLRLWLDGSSATTVVTVIAWKDHVGLLEVRCDTDDKDLRDRIAAAYKGREPALDEKGLSVTIENASSREGSLERRKVLGDALKIDPADELSKAYLLLRSPFADLVYGKMYGEDGGPPEARTALEQILAHAQGANLLDDILRGPNPEGRLYAAEGLLRLERKGKRLDEQTKKNIDWIRKSDVKIHVCDGCEVSWEPAAKALEAMLKDEK